MRASLVIMLAAAISGLLAAVVSLLAVVRTGVIDFRIGLPMMLSAFIVTVTGGICSLVGAVVRGFAVSFHLQTCLLPHIRSDRDVFVFRIVTLPVRPQGPVMSSATRERD